MAPKYFLLVAVSIGIVAITWGYPTGAPEETCKIFTANHTGHSAQNIQSDYKIEINPSSVASGSVAIVTIQGDTFKGFFIQAQDGAKNPIGQFKAKEGHSQTRDCAGPGSATAITHVDSTDKPSVSLEWVAPTSFKGTVVFRAVVVKNHEIFWDNLKSGPVSIV